MTLFFSVMRLLPPRSTLFPYTTLFRSEGAVHAIAVELTRHRVGQVHVPDAMRALLHRNADRLRGRGRRLEQTQVRSEEHTSELQSRRDLVCRLLLEKKKAI